MVTCSPISTWEGYEINTTELKFNSGVFVSCILNNTETNTNKSQLSGQISSVVTCSSFGDWRPSLPNCSGKFIHNFNAIAWKYFFGIL